jgi:hypothetical protein
MPCDHVNLGGSGVIVCSRGRKPKRCGWCAAEGTLLCDWKVGRRKGSGEPRTCDKPICQAHAQEVAHDKHLCPEHQEAYRQWQAKQQEKVEP